MVGVEVNACPAMCRVVASKVSCENGQCISGSADGSCIVWDLHRGVRVLALFEPNVFKGVRYHPDESQYITCGSNHKVCRWRWDYYTHDGLRRTLCCLIHRFLLSRTLVTRGSPYTEVVDRFELSIPRRRWRDGLER